MQEAGRIWPVWARSIGAMIEAEAIVRFACPQCERVYDVDLEALAMLRGRAWSLIGRRARCKASKCRASGRFVAAPTPRDVFLWLHAGEPTPRWIAPSTSLGTGQVPPDQPRTARRRPQAARRGRRALGLCG
jgi:hypothetical protein